MEEPAPRMFWPRVVWSKYACLWKVLVALVCLTQLYVAFRYAKELADFKAR